MISFRATTMFCLSNQALPSDSIMAGEADLPQYHSCIKSQTEAFGFFGDGCFTSLELLYYLVEGCGIRDINRKIPDCYAVLWP